LREYYERIDPVTGQIVGISRRTVAFHLDNARAKLGVQNLRQAIAFLASTTTNS
jgi:DNA-binding CsgD family transcriptional regulator